MGIDLDRICLFGSSFSSDPISRKTDENVRFRVPIYIVNPVIGNLWLRILSAFFDC